MMTQQLEFSVIAAPLAAMDRRALSQAWYSALHRAAPKPRTCGTAPVRPGMAQRSAAPHAAEPHAARATRETAAAPVARRDVGARVRFDESVERRAPRSLLARKIEIAFLHPAERPERASFTVEGMNGRVHVALQSTPRGMRLVAVCAPSLRRIVIGALEQARYALARRGIDVAFDVPEYVAW